MPNQIDPVCGMSVPDADDALKTEYAGQSYLFCSESCRSQFEKEPERFAAQADLNGGEKEEEAGGM
jgi:YHS domain-containing protein